MGYICDFCGDQRSMVYCRSDAACLCLSCDRNVHSANTLARRHSRTLLCERCSSQPALVRCSEEKISLCQNCDWLGHGNSASSNHKRQTINCYSGCPSSAELSSIWSFVLDIPSLSETTCEQELGFMSINENRSAWVDPKNQNTSDSDKVTDQPDLDKSFVGTSSIPESSKEPHMIDRPDGPTNERAPKLYCPATKCPEISEDDDDLYGDFDMDEMDINMENYDELFGMALTHSEELFENGGFNSLFRAKAMSAGDSNCQDAIVAEGSSIGHVNAAQPACSNAASADSILSTKTEPNFCITTKQSQSSLSFSGINEDGCAGDYQDCGASSMFLMGEPPWLNTCPENELQLQSANRCSAVMRYKEKKKTRKFDKRVRYASRKERADVRRRVKGRFVKAGEAYDYDPLSQTRSY
ncbi:unnamed protein product [Lathyrus oleraceus]|uniref:Zinc finger protein CONSTANS-LIKE 9-like n=1 Tax=Pisum sativum TaxID=3888 RepID=A0A9D4WQF9_PEA|nr:zinc finger protein CONSTANS-LIKE 9-like [Pisum sativum]KAI5406601.1 hypothetical protein KIW84_053080 [Pisum sativum]